MRLFLFLFFIPFFSYSNPCEFTAEVSPLQFRDRVESIYVDMCEWYHDTFKDYPIDSHKEPLKKVRFVESWDEVEYVQAPDELSGLFSMHTDSNEIVVLYPPQNNYWTNTEDWIDSLLAHEIFHYFKKACCYEHLMEIDRLDISLFEASAYWAQDQFLKRKYSTNLIDYVIDKKGFKRIINFEMVAGILYMMAMDKYIYNVPIWFDNKPKEKFDNLIKGRYTINPMGY